MKGFVAIALLAAGAVHAQSPVVALGKERAASSPLQWDVHETVHPALGPIVFATMKTPVATAAGSTSISSNVYVSCQRSTATIAIELANGARRDDPGGLKPKRMPRLTCNTPGANDGKPAAETIAAQWKVNDLGDAMARGLSPSALRVCASIGVSEELVLPAGSGRDAAQVEIEIPTYARELDAVFARCGEPTAWPFVADAPPPPAKSAAAAHPSNGDGWITARVVSEGHTNVRAKPDVRSALVIRIDPGDIVLVRKEGGDWWHAKSRPKAKIAFEGYIRRDRLVFR